MHVAFRLHELQLSVFSHLNLRDLFRVALTCNAFKDCAITLLWHELPSIDPILLTLPRDIWVYRRDIYNDTKSALRRSSLSTDWGRFNLYRSKVRKLSLQGLVFATDQTLHALAAFPEFLPKEGIFHNAHTVHIDFTERSVLQIKDYVHYFLGASLKNITIEDFNCYNSGVEPIPSFLSSLRSSWCQIRHLAIRQGVDEEGLEQELSLAHLLKEFVNLEEIDLDYVDMTPDLVRTLANLPNLHSWKQRTPAEDDHPLAGALFPPNCGFGRLRSLDVGVNWETASDLLLLIIGMGPQPSHPLRTLRIQYPMEMTFHTGDYALTDVKSQAKLLGVVGRYSGLTSLTIVQDGLGFTRERTFTVDQNAMSSALGDARLALQSLETMYSLKHIDLQGDALVCVDNDIIQGIAATSPNLRTLRLRWTTKYTAVDTMFRPRATLAVLQKLLASKHIERITLPINFSLYDINEELAAVPMPEVQEITLDGYGTMIGVVNGQMGVLNWLEHMFPNAGRRTVSL